MRLLRAISLCVAGFALVALGAVVIIQTGLGTSLLLHQAAVQLLSGAFRQQVTLSSVSWNFREGMLVLTDVQVGRQEAATGVPLFSAQRLLARLDLREVAFLLLRRQSLLPAIREIALQSPSLLIARDSYGRWNVSSLFARPPGQAPMQSFRAQVSIRNGTIFFRDARASSSPFQATLTQVEGSVDLARNPLVALDLKGRSQEDGSTPVRLRGKYILGEGTIDLELATGKVDLTRWGSYLVPSPSFSWTGGQVEARLNLLVSRRGAPLDYRGNLVFHGGEVRLARGLRITGLAGPVEVDPIRLRTSGLRLQAGASPLLLRGEVRRVPGLSVDLVASSPFLDLITLKRLLFPSAQVVISGSARGEVRILGPLTIPRIEGMFAAKGRVNGQRIDQLSSRVSYDGRSFLLSSARLWLGDGVVSGSLSWDLQENRITLEAVASGVQLGALRGLDPLGAGNIAGRFSGDLLAFGRGGEWYALAGGRLEGVRVGSVEAKTAEGVFWYDHGSLTLDSIGLRVGSGQVFLTGQVSPGGSLSLRVAASGFQVEELTRAFRWGGGLAGDAEIEGRIGGRTGDPSFNGDVTVRGARVGSVAFDRMQASLQASKERVTSRVFQLHMGSGVIRGAGTLSLVGGRIRSVRASAEIEDFPLDRIAQLAHSPMEAAGKLSGVLRLEGSPGALQGHGQIRLEGARIAGQYVDGAEAAGTWRDGVLTLERVEARVNNSKLSGRGRVTSKGELDLSVWAQGLNLEDFPPLSRGPLRMEGVVDLQGRIGGTLQSPSVRGEIASSRLSLNGQAFDSARGRVAWSEHRLSLESLELRQGTGAYRLVGAVNLGGQRAVDLTAEVVRGRLATLVGLSGFFPGLPADGEVSGRASLAGPIQNPSGSLDLRVENGILGGERLREAVGRVSWQDRSVKIERLEAILEHGRLAAQGTVDLRGESLVEVSGQGLHLGLFAPILRRVPGGAGTLRGTVDFIAQISGPYDDPLMGISLEIKDGGLEDIFFNRLTAQAIYQRGTLVLDQALLSRDGHKAKVQGEIPLDPLTLQVPGDRPVNLRATLVDADLSLLRLLTPVVEEARGTIEGEVSLTGSIARPRMAGRLGVAQGTIRLAGLEPALEGVVADLSFTEDRVTIRRLEAGLGGGKVGVAGGITIRNLRPETVDLQLSLTPASVKLPPYYSGRVEGELYLRGPSRRPNLAGKFVLSQGELTLARGEARSTRLPPVGLDLLAAAGRDLWVHAGALRARIEGELSITGTLSTPSVEGILTAAEGEFSYLGTTFHLDEGRASFSPFRGLEPYLNAKASTLVGSTRVQASVEGTPRGLSLTLSSEPPLPREEIVALLSRQAGLEALMQGDVEGALRLELSRLLFGRFERPIREALGLSEFRLEYDFIHPPRLRIGKFLLRELYFTITTIFDSVRQSTAALEYRLTPNTNLSLNYDPTRRFSISLQTRIRF
ncbi:MAG: translocation/assembly module TamB domain-containing protein [Armatimonadota bacterium]|nr:translocation/assembly module TamB domain-containing protein [Armatimonadota bacterium]